MIAAELATRAHPRSNIVQERKALLALPNAAAPCPMQDSEKSRTNRSGRLDGPCPLSILRKRGGGAGESPAATIWFSMAVAEGWVSRNTESVCQLNGMRKPFPGFSYPVPAGRPCQGPVWRDGSATFLGKRMGHRFFMCMRLILQGCNLLFILPH